MPAPVAVFAYKRPEHVKRTLASLAANPEAAGTRVVAFCDGPRRDADRPLVEATRAAVAACGLPGLEVVARERNLGLARSVIEGVGRLCAEHGEAIVLEDDLVVAPTLLGYMNAALARYRDEPRVMQISAHMFPVEVDSGYDAAFLPFVTSWGWATWQRAWRELEVDPAAGHAALARDRALRRRFDLGGAYPYYAMLERQLRGEIDSWAIRWNLSVFRRGGLVLYPARTLVQNEGFDGSGTHAAPAFSLDPLARAPFAPTRLPEPRLDEQTFAKVRRYLGASYSLRGRIIRRARRALGLR